MQENESTTSIQPQEQQPAIDDRSLADIAEQKKAQIEKSRKRFVIIYAILKVLGVLLLLALLGFIAYQRIIRISPPPFDVNSNQNGGNGGEENGTDVNTWTLYKNDKVRVYIRRPQNSTVVETELPALKVDVMYDKTNLFPIDTSEAALGEGYIFRVTPLNVGIREIDSMAQIKMESFKVKCPDTATFSKINKTTVDLVDARNFEILNCGADYIVSYAPRFGIYYEIAQIYKGDFGYKQKYRAILEEMMRAFKFYPESVEPVGAYKTFIDEKNKLMIVHPNLSETCCQSPPPPLTDLVTAAQLGDPATFKSKSEFDGMGIFIQEFRYAQGTLNQVVENQKKLLREDYKVVTGLDPETEDRQIKVGKYDGIMLKGYSWRGNDLVFIETQGIQRARLIIFSIMNVSGEEFEKKAMDMLSSFESFASTTN